MPFDGICSTTTRNPFGNVVVVVGNGMMLEIVAVTASVSWERASVAQTASNKPAAKRAQRLRPMRAPPIRRFGSLLVVIGACALAFSENAITA
jgi:hypothetical protein